MNPAVKKTHFCNQNKYISELSLQYSPKVFVAKFFSSPSSVNSLLFTIHPALLTCKTTPVNKNNLHKYLQTKPHIQAVHVSFLTLQHKATNCFNKPRDSKSHYSVADHKGFSQEKGSSEKCLTTYICVIHTKSRQTS